jgi:hypothetical protein
MVPANLPVGSVERGIVARGSAAEWRVGAISRCSWASPTPALPILPQYRVGLPLLRGSLCPEHGLNLLMR